MIGIFDSGIGGLSVFKELSKLMPKESYVYFSDSLNCPYGPKKTDFIIDRSTKITYFLIEQGADIIVVACNTATAAAISYLRSNFDLPFVGMEPAIKPAVLHSKSGVVGVLATAGTLKGPLYLNTLAHFKGDVKVIERVGDGLVEAVEKADFDSKDVKKLLRNYIEPMLNQGADHIVLGCTHYPFLQRSIEEILDGRAEIVNPALAVAQQTLKLLKEQKAAPAKEQPFCKFYSSASFTEPIQIIIKSLTAAPCSFIDSFSI
ncbi:MAG: glutamate racemase [Bacteroidales bacterium]|nr:glutamate racemase [Bacteroidales bacterium]